MPSTILPAPEDSPPLAAAFGRGLLVLGFFFPLAPAVFLPDVEALEPLLAAPERGAAFLGAFFRAALALGARFVFLVATTFLRSPVHSISLGAVSGETIMGPRSDLHLETRIWDAPTQRLERVDQRGSRTPS
jgi:hypothetical protein